MIHRKALVGILWMAVACLQHHPIPANDAADSAASTPTNRVQPPVSALSYEALAGPALDNTVLSQQPLRLVFAADRADEIRRRFPLESEGVVYTMDDAPLPRARRCCSYTQQR